MLLKFGQKIFAQRHADGEWEQGIVLKCDLPTVFIGFPDGTVWQVQHGRVKTKAEIWRETHAAEIRQKRWKKAAERQGKDLSEYVYAMEQRKARAEAKRDADAKKREYWRKRQQAHREKKAETDAE